MSAQNEGFCPDCGGPAEVVDRAPPGEHGDVVRCLRSCGSSVRTAARLFGQRTARAAFGQRERGGRRNVELHVSEEDLAAMLAMAWELGFDASRGKAGR